MGIPKRIFYFVLAVIMLSTCYVGNAFAAEPTNATPEYSEEYLEATKVELVDQRDIYSKHYRLADGTYQYVSRAEPMHYKAEDGSFKDIDCAITDKNVKSGYALANTANSWQASFAGKLGTDKAVLISEGDYSIGFSLPADTSTASVTAATKLTTAGKSAYYSSLKADNRAVLYEDVLTDVDIAYTVNTGHLKEDIILKSSSAPNQITFRVTAEGLTLKATEGGYAFNNSDGKTVFELAPLFMEDANGKYSENVWYTVESVKNGYAVTVNIDKSFLTAQDTVFPVVVDPSIQVTVAGTIDTSDTYASDAYPDEKFYLREYLWTGGVAGTNLRRAYLWFDFPDYIPSEYITSAKIRLTKEDGANPNVYAYLIMKSWSASTLCWNNRPKYYETIGHGESSYNATTDTYDIPVKSLLTKVVDGDYPNRGFIIKEANETSADKKTRFYSSNAANNKPELVINYTASFSLQLKHYIDEGYEARYGDSAFANVRYYRDFIEYFFEDAFPMNIQSTMFYDYISYPDQCKFSSNSSLNMYNLSYPCYHDEDHLIDYNISGNFYRGSCSYNPILWTGHILENNTPSASFAVNRNIIITPNNMTTYSVNVQPPYYDNLEDSVVRSQSCYEAIHEICHQLNAKDEYCNLDYDADPDDECSIENCYKCKQNLKKEPFCIMACNDEINILSDNPYDVICEKCYKTIFNHLKNYH